MLEGGESGPAMVPGSSAESLIIQYATGLRKPRMPLDGVPLSKNEIGVLRAWIDQGALEISLQTPSFSPASIEPRRPELPDDPSGQLANPIDRWVQVYLKQQAIPFPEPVADSVFVRRAYLDLWGLLPSPQERGAFVEDTSSDKRDLLIDLLLSENQKYAEHWMSYWNDLLRNDEGVRSRVYLGLAAGSPGDQFALRPLRLKALEPFRRRRSQGFPDRRQLAGDDQR